MTVAGRDPGVNGGTFGHGSSLSQQPTECPFPIRKTSDSGMGKPAEIDPGNLRLLSSKSRGVFGIGTLRAFWLSNPVSRNAIGLAQEFASSPLSRGRACAAPPGVRGCGLGLRD